MSNVEARLAALDARIDALRTARQQLKARRPRKVSRHESTAADDAKMQVMTTAQLRLELTAERRRYRLIKNAKGPSAGRKIAACRTKAKKIAEHIKANA